MKQLGRNCSQNHISSKKYATFFFKLKIGKNNSYICKLGFLEKETDKILIYNRINYIINLNLKQ